MIAHHPRARPGRVLVLALLLHAGALVAQQPITLEEALQRASVANAHLPVAALNTAIARAQLREARARVKPRLFLDGDVHEGAPAQYSNGDARIQAIAADTLFDGGRLRANVRVSEYAVRGAEAGYRMTQKDLELDVRTQFAEGVRAQSEIDIRQEGVERLRAYLSLLEALRAGGQGVAGDVLRTQSRLADEEANIADAERQLDEAEVELNELMGVSPRAPLRLAPLPPPVPPVSPAAAATAPWLSVPDIAAARANVEATRLGITIARADLRPQLSVTADVGALPTLGPDLGTGLNTGRGLGGEITFWFTMPLLDAGILRARVQQAQLAAQQAEDSALVVRRQAELEWSRAVEQLEDLHHIVQLRSTSVPLARDAYLKVESLYRGGVGTALDVLDAYATWIDSRVMLAGAERDYREAQARLQRWGTP